jgi:hypothetical protein
MAKRKSTKGQTMNKIREEWDYRGKRLNEFSRGSVVKAGKCMYQPTITQLTGSIVLALNVEGRGFDPRSGQSNVYRNI